MRLKGMCSAAVLTCQVVFGVYGCFWFLCPLSAGLDAGLDLTGFSVNETWQI